MCEVRAADYSVLTNYLLQPVDQVVHRHSVFGLPGPSIRERKPLFGNFNLDELLDDVNPVRPAMITTGKTNILMAR